MKNNNGFTLIELIVSIGLILLLFIVIMPTSTKIIQNSNKKQCESIVKNILTNAELYVMDRPSFSNTKIYLYDLYNNGYLDEKYDFKNGYILTKSNINDTNNYVIVIKNTSEENEEIGYNTYQLTINGITGTDQICK